MADFLMPSLGADMESATLMKWLVKPGDAVKRGDVIAEVETDKGLIEIECFETGVVEKVVVEPGAEIPVGAVLAVIQTAGAPAVLPLAAPLRATPAAPPAAPPLEAPLAGKPAAATPITPSGAGGARRQASPLARRLAAELGVDLSTLQGTGPGGVIERADVERAAAAKPDAPAAATGRGADGMRHAIAAAMAKSNREIPHYYLQTRIDMSRSLSWLESENLKRPIEDRLLPVVLGLKAVAKALREVPGLNGFWIDHQFRLSGAIHLGFAISMKGGGLVAPAIHDVDHLTCDEIMTTLRELIPRARRGRLRSSEMTDATLTVTNLGDSGVETVFGVIYPPQVALVGFGRIMEQPWAQNGMLGVHPVMTASLAADHRATDGHLGAQFLEALNRQFQDPATL